MRIRSKIAQINTAVHLNVSVLAISTEKELAFNISDDEIQKTKAM